ncbi:MAG: hypothetical protein GY869_11385 [Planctomycetes bacterium]|nr:hypothetical protein [Planctomycetota bacterium]
MRLKTTMFQGLMDRLAELETTKIEIRAEGEYPVKKRTKVQAVAHYQNDGTKYIKPARFVERSARRWRYWQSHIFRAAGKYMSGHGVKYDLNQMGMRIAYDINVAVNRIKTGRLKKSMRPILKSTGTPETFV